MAMTMSIVRPDAPTAGRRTPFGLRVALVVTGIAALVGPLLVVTHPPRLARLPAAVTAPKRVVPRAVLPPVEPVDYVDLKPDDARAINARVPFSKDANPGARPFRLIGSPDDAARATDCMAAAVLYEAGDDPVGQKAVAQVVLNRVRHPAFPKTVCGVVFQGAERRTGCQFTFTCDGALERHSWSAAAWERARAAARAALTGKVYKPVGYSTHYHTDWVVPYWSSSLDKVSAVGTHLFFRWTGWWGTPPAFNRRVMNTEPVVPQLAALSPAHGGLAAVLELGVDDGKPIPASQLATPTEGDPNTFLVTLHPALMPAAYARFAAQSCGERPYCKLMAWEAGEAIPQTLPLAPAQIATMAFSYLRDRARGYEKPLWNCARYKRPDIVNCMKTQALPTRTTLPVPTLAADGAKGELLADKPLPAMAADQAPPVLNVRRRARGGEALPVQPGEKAADKP